MARRCIGCRGFSASLGKSPVASSAVSPAWADDFPAHPITLIVPFAAGGSTDVLARLIAAVSSTIRLCLGRAFIAAVLSPAVRNRLTALGADPIGHGAQEFAEVLRKDLALWRRVTLASGVRVE